MKSMSEKAVAESLVERMERLRGDSPRQWGKMTANQMVCHLRDAYELALGEKTASMATGLFQQTVMKWFALYAPLPWPKGIATRPEMAQDGGGTPPVEFDADRAALVAVARRFSRQASFEGIVHPFFGAMSHKDWMRWGYLHADHHLRQFGV